MKRIKILHIITSPRAEGTPRLVLDWLKCNMDLEQYIGFLKHGDHEIYNDFKLSSNGTWSIETLKNGIWKIPQIIKFVSKLTKETNPDLVIAWTTGQSQWIHWGAWIGGIRKFIIHAGNPPAVSGIFQRYIYSWLTFWTAKILNSQVSSCSEYVKNEFLTIPLMPKRNFHSIYNCFDPSKFIEQQNNLHNPDTAIMVATLELHKDHETMLKAWRIVEQNNKKYKLQLAGDGSLRNHLENLSSGFQLRASSFLGSRNDIPDLLHQSSVFILSTTPAEGFGTVLLEALAAGLIVIATDVPACREVLKDGEYGVLVPPNDPETLAEAIDYAFANPITEKQKQKNIEYASSFTPERMMKEYLRVVGLEE